MTFPVMDKETDRLAREIAALTGETVTDAVRKSLAERLEREWLRRSRSNNFADQLMAIAHEFNGLPDYDTRSPDEILGYDDTGAWS